MSMEAAELSGVRTDQSLPSQTFSCVSNFKRFQIALVESAEKCVSRKIDRKVAYVNTALER